MNTKPSFAFVVKALSVLSDEELAAIVEKPELLKEFAGKRMADIVANTYVVHIDDKEVQEQYRETVAKWRKYAASLGYTGPVAWKVREGFTLKSHAPLAGPCYDKLGYLQSWNFADNPTADSMVFWVPRLAEQSMSKTITQMEALRAEQRRVHNLPEHHCNCFGSIQLLFALILAHFKRTGERVPLNAFYAASDTLCAVGGRLIAGRFDSCGLYCNLWDGSHERDCIGCFLLGVEELGQPAQKAGE